MHVLGKRRMMVVVTMAVLLLAVAAWIGSGANFSKTEAASANNTFSAGFVDITADGLGFTVGPMAPGGEGIGTATVENSGNIEGHFYLTVADLLESAGVDPNGVAAGRDLSDVLEVYVTGWGAGAVEEGPYTLPALASGASEFDCGVLAAGDTGTVTVRAAFPDGNAGGGRGADNGLMNAVSTVKLDWTVVSTGN
jgi:hypothetical protein